MEVVAKLNLLRRFKLGNWKKSNDLLASRMVVHLLYKKQREPSKKGFLHPWNQRKRSHKLFETMTFCAVTLNWPIRSQCFSDAKKIVWFESWTKKTISNITEIVLGLNWPDKTGCFILFVIPVIQFRSGFHLRPEDRAAVIWHPVTTTDQR